ncbi:MAG: hypothetical protein MZV64_34950 [Ignavibacteriales bacterium]|nr:hypothetical protein [Ignavibacteriales bacterium]
MTEEYNIVQLENPDDAAWEAVGGGIHHYNIQQAGDATRRPVYALFCATRTATRSAA